MSRPTAAVVALVESCRGQAFPPQYGAFFAAFNRQWFYEAHGVLEELWLAERGRPDADFFKGLIQLAGTFVHLQRDRRGPATALLTLARTNLDKYPDRHLGLDVCRVRGLIEEWALRLALESCEAKRLLRDTLPQLTLESGAA